MIDKQSYEPKTSWTTNRPIDPPGLQLLKPQLKIDTVWECVSLFSTRLFERVFYLGCLDASESRRNV